MLLRSLSARRSREAPCADRFASRLRARMAGTHLHRAEGRPPCLPRSLMRPRSSSPSAVFDGHPLPGRGVLRDQNGNVVDDWPDDKPIPHGWMVSRRLTAMDSAAGVLGGAALNLEDVFLALPRGIQRRRHQIEVDILSASDAFERGAALRLAEVTIRELLNIADLAEKGGSVPWDAGVSDPGILAPAARAAADYLRGFSDSALRMMGTSPAASSNGVGAAGDRAIGDSASVSDRQTAAFDAHQAMDAPTAMRCAARCRLRLQLRRGVAARSVALPFRTRTRRLARMRK